MYCLFQHGMESWWCAVTRAHEIGPLARRGKRRMGSGQRPKRLMASFRCQRVTNGSVRRNRMSSLDQSKISSILSVLRQIPIQVSLLSRNHGLEPNMNPNVVKQETSSALLTQVPTFSPHMKFVSTVLHRRSSRNRNRHRCSETPIRFFLPWFGLWNCMRGRRWNRR